MDTLRLLLVDDHLMVTEALASRLAAALGLWVADRCATQDPNLFDIVRGLRPDVITIEVEPLGSAVGEVLRRLVATRPTHCASPRSSPGSRVARAASLCPGRWRWILMNFRSRSSPAAAAQCSATPPQPVWRHS
jgi:NarL family two-component system response regulator LiaR